MEITDYKKDDILILNIKGKIDIISKDKFHKKLIEFIQKGFVKIILDCSSLDYISSAGIRVLYHLVKDLEEKNGKIILASPNSSIQEVFEIINLTEDFQVFKNIEEAVKAIKN